MTNRERAISCCGNPECAARIESALDEAEARGRAAGLAEAADMVHGFSLSNAGWIERKIRELIPLGGRAE